jgi:hypothetical protein
MNKFNYALALGAGLVLGLATPTVHADKIKGSGPVVQNLVPSTMSAADFNASFSPSTAALTDSYKLMDTPQTGVVESQVFQGSGKYAGLTAYAYQFGVNNVTDTNGQPTSVNSASLQFNATPNPVDLGKGKDSAVYAITDGKVGSIDLPASAPGAKIQIPGSVAWQPGTTTGSLTFQYLDATTNTGPLEAGAKSGTIVVITSEPKTATPFVSIQNANPQIGYPQAYAPTGGTIDQIPAPEPATILGWTSVVGALALVRRVRRNRQAA